ncbi:hypothetical protein SFRURICE_005209 [Spodoptera frugiperda]|nr:hypothetical protein SFRURICE_005209 [Spodoptera frugiperda]
MSVQTLLLDFSIDPARLGDEIGQKTVFGQLETVLKEYIPNLILATELKLEGGSLKLLTGKKGSTVSVRLFDRGLVTVNIEYYKEENEEPLINLKSARVLENQLKKYINIIKSQAYAPLKRCLFGRYYPTSDISEADLIYTETLMQRGKESYEGKEIVILGGGDGALLYELLKEKPKYVWMLEIDEVVMTACNKYLRSICGDVLETRKGPNYEVIVEDCMLTVNKFIADGKKVDYIFGDLTDIPISESACGELWEFMITILNSSFKILKPNGKFMTHGNGATSPESLELYEQELAKLKPPVKYTKSKAFVPSFLEDWYFYHISFATTDNGDA